MAPKLRSSTAADTGKKAKKRRVGERSDRGEGAEASESDEDKAAMSPPIALCNRTMMEGLKHLSKVDPVLATLIKKHDTPPKLLPNTKDKAFASLCKSIVCQQLSSASAGSILKKFENLCGDVEPEVISNLTEGQLRSAGLSKRKASYIQDLSTFFCDGRLSDESLAGMSNDDVQEALIAVKGIGVWTVHMFSIFHLGRPDILPVGDLAVRKGFHLAYELDALPKEDEMTRISDCWRPYRSLGAFYMWKALESSSAAKSPVKKKKSAKKDTEDVPE
ncbi:hypothetical protein BSKO_10298 [Bryopsis sp. KO-2023]|nr:hypothetical protein BSKO_10298 [Bryopsis sp. KO-2023]